MESDAALAITERIVAALESMNRLDDDRAAQIKQLHERDAELNDAILALSNRIEGAYRVVAGVLAMKAATRTMTCKRCRRDYAAEAGPPLCGPCWVELGEPERYLESVPTPTGAATDE